MKSINKEENLFNKYLVNAYCAGDTSQGGKNVGTSKALVVGLVVR